MLVANIDAVQLCYAMQLCCVTPKGVSSTWHLWKVTTKDGRQLAEMQPEMLTGMLPGSIIQFQAELFNLFSDLLIY